MSSFKPTFSLSSFTFIKRLFIACSLSAIRVVSSATLAPSSDRILVELFQILKDDAVESAALNMQYAICTQYAICRLPAVTHSDVLAWRISGTEEPGGLPSLGSHRVRHD